MRKRLLEEPDGRFYIGTSTFPRAGKGLFAKVSLAKGVRVEVLGVLVRANSVSDRCTHYADAYKFRLGRHLLIPLGYGAFVDHSVHPNLKKVVEGARVYLQTLRRIKKGEELCFRYSTYAQRRFRLNA